MGLGFIALFYVEVDMFSEEMWKKAMKGICYAVVGGHGKGQFDSEKKARWFAENYGGTIWNLNPESGYAREVR